MATRRLKYDKAIEPYELDTISLDFFCLREHITHRNTRAKLIDLD